MSYCKTSCWPLLEQFELVHIHMRFCNQPVGVSLYTSMFTKQKESSPNWCLSRFYYMRSSNICTPSSSVSQIAHWSQISVLYIIIKLCDIIGEWPARMNEEMYLINWSIRHELPIKTKYGKSHSLLIVITKYFEIIPPFLILILNIGYIYIYV